MRLLVTALLAGLLAAQNAWSHEIPQDVLVRVYVKPERDRVEALVRVPLNAMRDVEFPLRGPGYLDLGRTGPELETAARTWLVNAMNVFADGAALAAPQLEAFRVALPGDRSFDAFATARAAVHGDRLTESVEIYWAQALLDVALSYPNPAGPAAQLEVDPRFGRLGISTVTRITVLPGDGEPRTLTLLGDPGRVSLDPGFVEVFRRFLGDGFGHVLDGTDHLLFVMVLIIPLLVLRPLVVVITAFTLAHSLTLGAAALGLVPTALWFPALVELLIALSIFYMALENVLRPTLRRRWLEAFGFGLVHGFGFSFALRENLPLAGDHLLASLAGFNLGIELGQLLVLAAAVPALRLLARVIPGRGLAIVLSALVAHTAWHWLAERWQALAAYEVTMPSLDAAFAVALVPWLMLGLTAALLVWLVHGPFERWATGSHLEP
ncbi:MAG TPA: HupE/UreJ family protein [Pseudomonadales bacterium]